MDLIADDELWDSFDTFFGQGPDCPGSADFYREGAHQDAWSGPSQTVLKSPQSDQRHVVDCG